MKNCVGAFLFLLTFVGIGLNFPAAFETKAQAALLPDWTNVSNDPFTLVTPPGIENPVLEAIDVTDVTASFVADPFIIHDNGMWYMFFEVFIPSLDRGEIGVATSSDGLHWSYDRIVLSETFHLSYPLVLKYNGEYYMIPESAESNGVQVYRATNFPYDWIYAATIVSDKPFVDPTVFLYNNKWWMFTANDGAGSNADTLYLYYSNELLSGWTEHPLSPIVVNDPTKARSGGRAFVFDNNRIIRIAQKNDIIYGQRDRAFQIDVLTETDYSEHEIPESPILYESGNGWNALGMHQFDPWWTGNQWICAVDGNNNSVWSIGIYTAPQPSIDVSIITPVSYVPSHLMEGDEYYVDRTYVLTSVPSELASEGEQWIKTKNEDKWNTSSSHLEFTISQDATIYVAYDSRATSPPNWLKNNFTLTALTVGVSEEMGYFVVYKKDFSAGTVTLGGNFAAGAAGSGLSNYIVIIQPQSSVAEICDNAVDDDGDNLIDCADPDCSSDPACQTCTDGDFDTYYAESGCGTDVDCDDADPNINPGAAEICNDTIDNDCDSLTDCNDADCYGDIACPNTVTIIKPLTYLVAVGLQVGDQYYVDRAYVLTSVPSEVASGGEQWIKTKNDDKWNTSSSHLEFTISQDATVYVAYDSRATSPPNWLKNNFTLTALTVGVSEEMGYFVVYKKDFSAGTVTLGGNFAAGAAGSGLSNYIVIIQPQSSVAEICDNAVDDDGDNLIDCADPDCSSDPACQTCTDGDFDTYYAESGCGTDVDCDDADPNINPGAAEICNDTIDNDCDSLIDCNDLDCSSDPACQTCTDGDFDTYYAESGCGTDVDCDDADPNINPGAAEICNDTIDNDCDSLIDCNDLDCSSDPACQTCTDGDFDTYYAESGCGTDVDCDDADPNINPGAAEICNDTIDNDCDSLIDCNDADCYGDIACPNTVTIIKPLTYLVAVGLQVGDQYYVDRAYVLTSVPSEVASGGEQWIKTKNDDKWNTSSSHLEFTISQDATVYVAYDSRATSPPNWLKNNFTLTALTVGVSEEMGYFVVYKKDFSAGTVTLGGNFAAGAAGSGLSNYIVIIQPQSSVAEICDNAVDDDGDNLIDCADPDCSSDPACSGGTVLFFDDFSDENADGWTVVAEGTGTQNWQVLNSAYHQENSVEALTQSYHLGTFSYLSNWFPLTDFRFSVRIITPLDSYGQDVGVMFRYLNSDNYYRLSFNSQYGHTRLEKKVNGSFSNLLTNARGYQKGQVLNILIEVAADKIFAYVDGEPLFSVTDPDISSGTIALYCENYAIFDDVYIETISSSPKTIISKPTSYSVHPSNTLDVSAQVLNAPVGGSVEFRLYNEQTDILVDQATGVEASAGYYTANFYLLPGGNYRVVAILLDNSSMEVARDTNSRVGVQGDSVYTLGDSITNGTGDNFWADNISDDGRMISFSGYQAELSDLLTADLSYPHVFFNEGVGGDESIDTLLLRINSVVQRHPDSNKVIMLIGTNDSGGMFPLDSGKGCSGSDCDGTYKGNMIQLQDIILGSPGVENLKVALVPPAFGSSSFSVPPFANPLDATRNQIIQDYNDVILNEIPNIEIGPDLFGFFIDKFSLFRDNFHSNALGYLVMSYLFFDPSENTLPFILENLVPSNPSEYPSTYKQNILKIGDTYYIDRSYFLTSIPEVLKTGVWIMTANDNKWATSATHITFNVDRPCAVYVAYDSRATSPPNWLKNNFTLTPLSVGTSEEMGYFKVYKKDYSAGAVTLGGNFATGAAGTGLSNYIVIVVPQ